MSNSIARPTRERRQPLRNKDKVQLNLELIQRLENSKGNRGTGNTANANGKLLISFINAINESFKLSQDEVKEKQSQIQKYTGDQAKQIHNGSYGMAKRSKLIEGKVNQYRFENSKLDDRKVERATESKPYIGNNKTRSSNSYIPKKEMQKGTGSKEKMGKQESNTKNGNMPIIKPFKRYSYHAAIAYRIHIEKLKLQQNQNLNPELLDPTYPAKKLKQEQTKTGQ